MRVCNISFLISLMEYWQQWVKAGLKDGIGTKGSFILFSAFGKYIFIFLNSTSVIQEPCMVLGALFFCFFLVFMLV